MKTTKIIYWVATVLLSLLMLFSAVAGFMPTAEGTAMMEHIGYGPHVLPFLSVLKVLGVIALFVPGFPRVREWAYAGFTFDLLGAIYSFIAVGDPIMNWSPLILGLIFVATSYIYWHKLEKMRSSL